MFRTSRKIPAASGIASSAGAAQAVEVDHDVDPEDRQAEERVDHVGRRDLDEDQHDPRDQQADQREEREPVQEREVAAGRVAARAEDADEQRGRAERLADGLGSVSA